MKTIAGISLALLLACAACDTSSKPSFDGENSVYTSIAYLKTFCVKSPTLLSQELTIRGVVTANDIREEFPQAIVIEDATGGIEIAIDRKALADLYPLGAAVTVSCTGLALGEYGGKIRLGAKPTGLYSVDRIPGADAGRYIRCTDLNAHTRRPRTRMFDEVGPADADTYVRFESVRFAEANASWCDIDPETEKPTATVRTLIDRTDNRFAVRVLPQSIYAAEPIPEGTGSVNGIVDYFNGELSLRIVNYEIDFSISAMLPKACLSVGECAVPKPMK